MIIRRKLFSSKKKDDKEVNTAKAAAGLGGAIVGRKILKKGRDNLGEYLDNSRNNSKEAEKVRRELLKEAKRNGVKVEMAIGTGNSMYTGRSKFNRWIGDKIEDLVGGDLDSLGPMGKVVKNLGKDKVLLDSGSLRDVDVLSHELGHAHHSSKRSKNIIGKVSHKLMTPGKMAAGSSGVVGFVSGMRSAKKRAEGEEEGKVNKNISWALPAVGGGTVLAAEASASHKGLKDLERLGASKAVKGSAKKRLAAALGTYAAHVGTQIAGALGAREAGKLLGKAVYKKKKED